MIPKRPLERRWERVRSRCAREHVEPLPVQVLEGQEAVVPRHTRPPDPEQVVAGPVRSAVLRVVADDVAVLVLTSATNRPGEESIDECNKINATQGSRAKNRDLRSKGALGIVAT